MRLSLELRKRCQLGCLFPKVFVFFVTVLTLLKTGLSCNLCCYYSEFLNYALFTENSRPLQVLRYKHEEAKRRYDYLGNKSAWEVGEPLMATLVLYLSNVSRGGEISFPESKVRVDH